MDYERRREELQEKEKKIFLSHHELQRLAQDRAEVSIRREQIPQKLESIDDRIGMLKQHLEEIADQEEGVRAGWEEKKKDLEEKEIRWREFEDFLNQQQIAFVDESQIEEKNNHLFESYRTLYDVENQVKLVRGKREEVEKRKEKIDEEFKEQKEKKEKTEIGLQELGARKESSGGKKEEIVRNLKVKKEDHRNLFMELQRP